MGDRVFNCLFNHKKTQEERYDDLKFIADSQQTPEGVLDYIYATLTFPLFDIYFIIIFFIAFICTRKHFSIIFQTLHQLSNFVRKFGAQV